ncbi:MAG: hypothetical protein Q8Q69_05750 [Nitrosopumilaceae archaeon]|nr:hypothetical protein [Nitrosopumilaceae archaeon]
MSWQSNQKIEEEPFMIFYNHKDAHTYRIDFGGFQYIIGAKSTDEFVILYPKSGRIIVGC